MPASAPDLQKLLATTPLDRTRQAAPQVFERLRATIVGMDLVPGTVLPRAELAAALGLSQTPVRDALMRLSEEGLVDIFPQHTTVVSRIDISAAWQAQFLRRSLEMEIVYTLAQEPDPRLAARLQRHIDTANNELEAGAYAGFIAADQAFHREMHQAAGVTALWELEQRYSGHMDRLRRLHLPEAGKARRILEEHRLVCDAIAAGDVGAAQAALRRHLSGTLGQIDEICRKYPGYVRGVPPRIS